MRPKRKAFKLLDETPQADDKFHRHGGPETSTKHMARVWQGELSAGYHLHRDLGNPTLLRVVYASTKQLFQPMDSHRWIFYLSFVSAGLVFKTSPPDPAS